MCTKDNKKKMIKEDTSMNFMRFYLITKEDRWQFRLCEPLPGLRRKKKEKKGGICYVLTAFYILLYSRPGLSLLAVRDISITMKILLP